MSLKHWQEVEVAARRKSAWTTSGGLPHPDECPKLVIQGVAWIMPTRETQMVPVRTADGIVAQIEGEDKWPVADELIRDAPIREVEHCETCGQAIEAVVEVLAGAKEQLDWLGRIMSLAWELLDVFYKLDDGQKKALLSFSPGGAPEWLSQILNWCRGDLSKGVLDG